MNSSDHTPKLLIVEDQSNWKRLYRVWLRKYYDLTFSSSREEALATIKSNEFNVVIMDLGLPNPNDGLIAIKQILELQKPLKIIVVTAMEERDWYLRVQELGVYAVFNKNERLETEIPVLVRKAFEIISLENENLQLQKALKKGVHEFKILGESEIAANLRTDVKTVSNIEAPVLITGATGVGKNFLAQYIHSISQRSQFPFITLNCANFPSNLMEAELFGHEKGAFTGASHSKKGKFEMAEKGTILLDEIAEIPYPLQAKLLQVIEDKTFYRLGSTKLQKIDVRIFAATNHNLSDDTRNEKFRSDLYHRLAGYRINIPELKERKMDIPVYFKYFLESISNSEGLTAPECEDGIFDIIEDFPWNGNFREMKNVITRLLLFRPTLITKKMLMKEINVSQHAIINKFLKREYSLKEISALYAQEMYRKYGVKAKLIDILKIDGKTLNKYLEMKVEK